MASAASRNEVVATQLAASRHATRMALRQQPSTLLDHVDRTLVRFDHDFIDRKFREHRDHMEQVEAQLASEIISEVADALDHAAQMCAGKGPHKIARLK